MIPILLTTNFVFIIFFTVEYSVDIDGVHEPIFGSLLYGNNIFSETIIPSFTNTSFDFYPIGEVTFVNEWLHNREPMSQLFMSSM